MAATVLNYDNLDEQRRKRARFMAPYEMDIRAKRKRLDEIYEQRRAVLESEICANIESELASKRRRRAERQSAALHDRQEQRQRQVEQPIAPPPPPASVTTTYDEETVRLMISVALETQKQTLFEPFIEEHIAVLQEHRQALTTLQQEAAAAALHDRHFTYVS